MELIRILMEDTLTFVGFFRDRNESINVFPPLHLIIIIAEIVVRSPSLTLDEHIFTVTNAGDLNHTIINHPCIVNMSHSYG